MPSFPRFPCCCCCGAATADGSQSSSSLEALVKRASDAHSFKADLVFLYAFDEFVRHVDPESGDCMFVDPAEHQDDPEFTDRERNASRALYGLLKAAARDPAAAPAPAPSASLGISKVEDLSPALRERLSKIRDETLVDDDPARVLSGGASYQRLAVDCLLFAAKAFSACASEFEERHKFKIFDETVRTLEEFFESEHVFDWIRHCSRVLDPFGKLDDECDEYESSSCCSWEDVSSAEEEEEEEESVLESELE